MWNTELAADTHRRLVNRTRVSGTTGHSVSRHARRRSWWKLSEPRNSMYAIERLGRTRIRTDLARAHLLYGEWLRRERRRLDARRQLPGRRMSSSPTSGWRRSPSAHASSWTTGEHARRRTVDTLDQLTPQEAQISRLVAQGNMNREIAAQLFISPSTVEYHLRKVFRKLGVKSRTQLANRLRD